MSAHTAAPPDQAARDRIATDLDTTLFVEAGAGSGKTTALVARVVALVVSGAAELGQIAAITFTEKAGAELRDRIRRSLQETATDPAASPEAAARCTTALAQLDGAAIGTLHAFAQRLLSQHPVEARLPPRVEVLDEVTSAVAFDRRWARVLDQLLDDPALERSLLLLHAAGVDPTKLRTLALAFDASWDLVEDLVAADAPEPPSPTGLLSEVRRHLAEVALLADECIDPTDALAVAVADFATWGRALDDAAGDELDCMDLVLGDLPKYRKNAGKGPSWRGCKEQVHEHLLAVADAVAEVRRRVLDGCAHRLGAALRRHTLDAAEARRSAGTVEFHDLLVLARQVLRDPDHGPDVRKALHERYQRLLLDEFQDTDPIQIELAVRIASADPVAADGATWDAVEVAPGRLFVVGDPKQSIYRFRRADISTFIEAQQRFSTEAGGSVGLAANFRTVGPVIDWVNHTFRAVFEEAPDTDVPYPSQPAYVPLAAQRGAPPAGPAVAVVGTEAHRPDIPADELRRAEATDVAHTITTALRDGWPVHESVADPVTGERTEAWRPCRRGDITILVPARTTLPFLEDALDAARVPYRAESSSLVYASRAVRDLLMVLRAADDPTDHLRIVAALRTPLLGCGDDDLFRHKVLDGGSWAYTTPRPPDPEGTVVEAGLAFLRSIHEARHWQSPAELLDRIARERRAFELGFVEGRPRDVWRRIRFVIDQARAWSEATGGSLRGYLRWVEQQSAEGSRVAEAVLPETDDDAVRIMTIHAAKGLEFPITIVSGLSSRPGGRRSPVEVHFPRGGGTVGYRIGPKVLTEELEANQPFDEQMGYDERVRLLYVACTRAMDHLVVSLHRKDRANPPKLKRNRTNAEVLLQGIGDRLADLPDVGGEPEPLDVDPSTIPAPPADRATWAEERAAAVARSARPGAVAATALTEEGEPDAGADTDTDAGTGAAPTPGAATGTGAAAAAPAPGEPGTQGALFDPDPRGDGDPGPLEPPLDESDLLHGLESDLGTDPETDVETRGDAESGAATGADGVDPGLQKRPRDLDLPPWLKGRYGTAVGRAVHGVLQTIDLATDPDVTGSPSATSLDAAVAAQCQAEAVPERADDVRALVASALGSPVVRDAARAPHWREVYACTPLPTEDGSRLLEGYVDLLYRGDDGLVVVDHKTAATADPAELDRRVAGYRLQGAAYAVAVGRATGEAVTRVVFLFLTPSGAVERDLADLPAAMADVERLVANGQELLTP